MPIVVDLQFGALLRSWHLTVAALGRQLYRRFGQTVSTRALRRLAGPGPIRHAGVALPLAIAATLGVGLGDLFAMRPPLGEGEEPAPALGTAPGRRRAELLDLRVGLPLTAVERAELDGLVLDYSRAARDRELRRHADEHGLTFEQALSQVRAQVVDSVERERAAYPAPTTPDRVR